MITHSIDEQRTPRDDSQGQVLFWSFVACLLLVSLPVKNLAYLAPLVYLAVQLYFGNVRLMLRMFALTAVVALVSVVSLMWDSLRGQEVNVPGMALAIVTHLPLLILLCEQFNRRIDDQLFDRFVSVCAWFVIVQSMIGLAQFAATGNPDAVCGTYGLLDGFRQNITIAQVYFTFTVFGMMLFMLGHARRPLVAVALVIGLVACAAAQSGHQTIFLAAALGICGAIRFLRPKVMLATVVLAGLLLSAVYLFYPNTYSQAVAWYEKVVENPESPKRVVLDGATDIMSDAKNLVLGTGFGQYCSRAALITSNTYLSVDLPAALSGQSDYYTDYVVLGNENFEEAGEGSALSKPYFSMLSLAVELGLLQMIALVGVVAVAVSRNIQITRNADSKIALLGFAANVGIVFFLLCCLVENYAEFPQAIFLPVLLYVVALSRAQLARPANERSVGP